MITVAMCRQVARAVNAARLSPEALVEVWAAVRAATSDDDFVARTARLLPGLQAPGKKGAVNSG